MAVLSVEVFARTDDVLLSPTQQYDVYQLITHALMPLRDPSPSASTLVVGAQVTAHESGAYIWALCMAASGITASEAIAHHITTAALAHIPDGDHWQLNAGVTVLVASEN